MKQVTAILLGAGQRGADVYAEYALQFPNELKIIAVAEPRKDRREAFAQLHNIPAENVTDTWEPLLEREKFADCVLVCTQDRMHFDPVMIALEKGYDVLCEKPMSGVKRELIEMGAKAKQTGRVLSIAHTLRYSPFFMKLKELLETGAIGQLCAIQHMESVGYWHMAHSFVRGNWRREDETSPMILQKCCHDLDILSWLVGTPLETVSSFGSLSHFCAANKPEGAPAYCLDGCDHRDTCPYYAPRFYLEHPKAIEDGFQKILTMDTTREGMLKALEKGPYGRCVYGCDNTVVDHQVVNLNYQGGVTVSMTMSAFTKECERNIILMGSHGQIFGNMEKSLIEVRDFATGNTTTIHVHTPVGRHSGSDTVMMKEFLTVITSQGAESRSNADASVESHLAALAAEESRLMNGKPVFIQEEYKKI